MRGTLLTEFWGVFASVEKHREVSEGQLKKTVEKYSVKVREGPDKGFLSETFLCFLCSSGC